MFCDFLEWMAGTTRPGQCGRKSAHISWPAGYSPPLIYFMRRRHHLQRRAPARTERSQLLWTLPGQNSKKMLHWTCISFLPCAYILTCTYIFTCTYILLPLIVPRMSALFFHRPPICERATDHTYIKGCSHVGKKCGGTKRTVR
jgi:hypothetical protein